MSGRSVVSVNSHHCQVDVHVHPVATVDVANQLCGLGHEPWNIDAALVVLGTAPSHRGWPEPGACSSL